jgi:hypothetical protein
MRGEGGVAGEGGRVEPLQDRGVDAEAVLQDGALEGAVPGDFDYLFVVQERLKRRSRQVTVQR